MKRATVEQIFEVFKKEFMDVFMTEWIHVEFFEPLLNEALAKTIDKLDGDEDEILPEISMPLELDFDI